MIQIEIRRPEPSAACRPESGKWGQVVWLVILLALLWSVWGASHIVWADPSVGSRVHLPILSFVGTEATSQTLIQVQNVGSEFTQAVMLIWGEPGACGPQAVGPFKVECTGILKPGATWLFAESQIPQGGKSAIIYTFPVDEIILPDGRRENLGDAFCELLFQDVVFDADAFRRFDLAYRQGLEYLGLPTAGGQPIAVDVVRLGQGDPSPELLVTGAYSGLTIADQGTRDPVFGGFAYYAPVVYADALGLSSWLYVQNVGIDCTTVEMWFQEQEDCLDATICEIFTLAPGETAQYDVNECVGPSFVGSVWIRTAQPVGVVVDHIGQDILMTDRGMPAKNAITEVGSQVLYGPLIYREFQGWQSSIYVQNLSGIFPALVQVTFFDNSGDIITTLVDWICPRGSQSFFLPVINGLPGRFVGAVRVESLSTFRSAGGLQEFVPIAAVAHLVRYSDPTAAVPLEAVSYNLFPEPQAFDFQLGPGFAGLIGIPSLLKNKAGLSTEIAIQNVNPNPGFTDFAIYLYDANGLIDVICTKLSSMNVDYINVNSWGYLNPGFSGSAVISAVYTDQRGGFGLTAVAIERVGAVLQFDVPGDESSGHEAFPLFGEFHFQGPSAPACPGLGENLCNVIFTGFVYDDTNGNGAIDPGEPRIRGALLQFFDDRDGDGVKDATELALGTTGSDSSGLYHITLQQPGDNSTNWAVQITWDGKTDTQVIGPVVCGVQPVLNLDVPDGVFTIEGFAFNDADGDGQPDAGEARLPGTVIILQGDTDKDGVLDDEVAPTTTDAAGRYRFSNIDEALGLCAPCTAGVTQVRQFQLKAQLTDAAGALVSFLSPQFDLTDNYDGSVEFVAGKPEQPNFLTDGDPATAGEAWVEPSIGAPPYEPVNGPGVD